MSANWPEIIFFFVLAETISGFICFPLIARFTCAKPAGTGPSSTEQSSANDIAMPELGYTDILKGAFERIVITLALTKGFPQILIFFGAMKLGTRLKTGNESDGYNDFFLIGNLYSVALAIVYTVYLIPLSGQIFSDYFSW